MVEPADGGAELDCPPPRLLEALPLECLKGSLHGVHIKGCRRRLPQLLSALLLFGGRCRAPPEKHAKQRKGEHPRARSPKAQV